MWQEIRHFSRLFLLIFGLVGRGKITVFTVNLTFDSGKSFADQKLKRYRIVFNFNPPPQRCIYLSGKSAYFFLIHFLFSTASHLSMVIQCHLYNGRNKMKTLKQTALVLFFLLFTTTAWADQEADIKAVRKVLEDYSEFNLAGDAKS